MASLMGYSSRLDGKGPLKQWKHTAPAFCGRVKDGVGRERRARAFARAMENPIHFSHRVWDTPIDQPVNRPTDGTQNPRKSRYPGTDPLRWGQIVFPTIIQPPSETRAVRALVAVVAPLASLYDRAKEFAATFKGPNQGPPQ